MFRSPSKAVGKLAPYTTNSSRVLVGGYRAFSTIRTLFSSSKIIQFSKNLKLFVLQINRMHEAFCTYLRKSFWHFAGFRGFSRDFAGFRKTPPTMVKKSLRGISRDFAGFRGISRDFASLVLGGVDELAQVPNNFY